MIPVFNKKLQAVVAKIATRIATTTAATASMAAALLFSGCAPARQSVSLDAPKLAFALMFVGVCAVLCSFIGGFSLVRSTKNKRNKN